MIIPHTMFHTAAPSFFQQLLRAIADQDMDSVTFLLNKGADVTYKDKNSANKVIRKLDTDGKTKICGVYHNKKLYIIK